MDIQNGNETAFDGLFKSHYGKLVGFACQYTKQPECAEEIVSALFVKLWVKRETLSRVLRPEVYLYVSVKNACLNLIRSNKKRTSLFLESETDVQRDITGEGSSAMEDKELRKLLDAAVATLPEQRRMIFRLVKEDGLKPAAVAQILGLSKRTVENQLYKAIKTLAKAISDYLGYHPQSKAHKRRELVALSALFFL
ncbi:MAG: RNA polymerase sigma-70 factor [Pedobacter sp.]|nr:MAG: RNA polymerase sigma-70 factor [Pedobacter sp.]